MGLYDYIRCDMPLPPTEVPPPAGETFQTKDTPDQYMTLYTITADGRLSWRPWRLEEVPKEERPHPDADDDDIMSLLGSVRRVESAPEYMDYHGDIDFYVCGTTRGQSNGGWWKYRARFTDGRCSEITLREFSAPADHINREESIE